MVIYLKTLLAVAVVGIIFILLSGCVQNNAPAQNQVQENISSQNPPQTQTPPFDARNAITEADLSALGITSGASLSVKENSMDVALGNSDMYTYEVEGCDFILREYASPSEAKGAFEALKGAYSSGGLFASAKWAVTSEGKLGENSFEATQSTSNHVRVAFAKSSYLVETSGYCAALTAEQVRSMVSKVFGKI